MFPVPLSSLEAFEGLLVGGDGAWDFEKGTELIIMRDVGEMTNEGGVLPSQFHGVDWMIN